MARHMLTGTVILAVLWLSACSSANVLRSQPPARKSTPIETAVSWFHAIDADNVVAARDLFVLSQRRNLLDERPPIRIVKILPGQVRHGFNESDSSLGLLHLQIVIFTIRGQSRLVLESVDGQEEERRMENQ